MKRLLISLLCTAALAACSSSGNINQKAVKLADQEMAKQGQLSSSVELYPENVANYDEKVDAHKIDLALNKTVVGKVSKKERNGISALPPQKQMRILNRY